MILVQIGTCSSFVCVRRTGMRQKRASRPHGATYGRAEPNPTLGSEPPFTPDPTLVDRALKAHANVQNGERDFLQQNGADPRSSTPSERHQVILVWATFTVLSVLRSAQLRCGVSGGLVVTPRCGQRA